MIESADLVAPELIDVEVLSVLRRAVLHRKLDEKRALEAVVAARERNRTAGRDKRAGALASLGGVIVDFVRDPRRRAFVFFVLLALAGSVAPTRTGHAEVSTHTHVCAVERVRSRRAVPELARPKRARANAQRAVEVPPYRLVVLRRRTYLLHRALLI